MRKLLRWFPACAQSPRVVVPLSYNPVLLREGAPSGSTRGPGMCVSAKRPVSWKGGQGDQGEPGRAGGTPSVLFLGAV